MTREQAEAHLHAGVLKTDTCWVWLGKRYKPQGYAAIVVDGRFTQLHRLSYELHRGPIPDGLVIDHLCRRPYCMNPWHMETVTRGENSRRGENAKRSINYCPKGHPYSGENLILEPRKDGGFSRKCRTCKRERNGYQGYGEGKRKERCKRGHLYAEHGYIRPDGRGRQCRECQRILAAERTAKTRAAT